MSREIKFRAWNGEQMVSPDYITRDGIGYWKENSIPSYSTDLMQFTGLKDKNELDIYEGDELSYTIFDYNDNDKQYTGVVKWFSSGFVVTQVPDNQGNGEYGIELFWIYSQDDELEVIGNIHENKQADEEIN
tara:strand:+ start:309 stop:704 length:396 start_codon:yes stop_codon:yes gene_type:complete